MHDPIIFNYSTYLSDSSSIREIFNRPCSPEVMVTLNCMQVGLLQFL
jgi:hypothetical protein